jgi:hypothetical protein
MITIIKSRRMKMEWDIEWMGEARNTHAQLGG